MRVLLSTGSPATYMAPPHLGEDQVNCGPDWVNADVGGHVLSLATPDGEYDLRKIARHLPPEQQPEIVVCLVDSARRALPRNLRSFRCPKVLLVADTHHLINPIRQMIRYAQSEPFDRIVLMYARHHWEFFHAAGLKNLYWFPGLTFPHHDADVVAARSPERDRQVAFVGQTGICHPRRIDLLSRLGASGLPLAVKELSQRAALQFYGRSLVGINASLNGDLNLRVLEIMASGAMLLTDELSAPSGLSDLWAVGRELVTYASPGEMAERAQHALQCPEEAMAIGEAGAGWFDKFFNATRRRQAFQDLALSGTVPEPFSLPRAAAIGGGGRPTPNSHFELTAGFEYVQELHRNLERVTIALDETVPEEFARMCLTLPRVTLQRGIPAPGSKVTFLAVGRLNVTFPSAAAAHVWFWNGTKADRTALVERCSSQGLFSVSEDRSLFAQQVVNTHQSHGAQARVHLEQGNYEQALVFAKKELSANPNMVDALLTMLELGQETGNAAVMQTFTARLAKVAPHHPGLRQLEERAKAQPQRRRLPERLARAASVYAQSRRWAEAEAFAQNALKFDRRNAEAHSILGLTLQARGQPGTALNYLTQAAELAPASAVYWHQLGRALRHLGRTADALAAFIQATEVEATNIEMQLALADSALAAGHGAIASEALGVVNRLLPGHPLVRTWGEKARELTTANTYAAPRDLLISHVEVCRLQGSGVLLQRFFPDAKEFVTVRSRTLYRGAVDLGGAHFSIDLPGLPAEARRGILRRLLAPYRIRRILAVPFFPADFEHALVAKELTGAPLCTYVMDDQTLYCGEVAPELAQQLFTASELRLAISREMIEEYRARFGCSFGLLPPIISSRDGESPNRWNAATRPSTHCALVGNIWSAHQFERVRVLIREAGLTVDWFGNADVSWLPQDRQALARDGLHCRGFVPEPQLAGELSQYPFVLIPSGALDGTEDNEWLTRLSLPSRMVFIVAKTFTPMLVLGSAGTAAARFVRRFGLGASAGYDPIEAREKILEITAAGARARLVQNARRAAGCFLMPEAGEWIWRSLAAGRTGPTPFDSIFDPAAIGDPAAANDGIAIATASALS